VEKVRDIITRTRGVFGDGFHKAPLKIKHPSFIIGLLLNIPFFIRRVFQHNTFRTGIGRGRGWRKENENNITSKSSNHESNLHY